MGGYARRSEWENEEILFSLQSGLSVECNYINRGVHIELGLGKWLCNAELKAVAKLKKILQAQADIYI